MALPKKCRDIARIVTMFKPSSMREIETWAQEVLPGFKFDDVKQLMRHCYKDRHDAVMVDRQKDSIARMHNMRFSDIIAKNPEFDAEDEPTAGKREREDDDPAYSDFSNIDRENAPVAEPLPPGGSGSTDDLVDDKPAAVLTIDDDKPSVQREGVGTKARWNVKGLGPGFILQEVEHSYTKGNKTYESHFTEAWTVRRTKNRAQDDHFLVPWDAREKDGNLSIKAKAWFLPQKVGKSLKNMNMQKDPQSIAGELHYKEGSLDKEFRREPTVVRKATSRWNKTAKIEDFNPVIKNTRTRNG